MRGLRVLGQPIKSGEATDFEAGRYIISSGIHLDNFDIFVLQSFGNLKYYTEEIIFLMSDFKKTSYDV